jgi:hypothetical protein
VEMSREKTIVSLAVFMTFLLSLFVSGSAHAPVASAASQTSPAALTGIVSSEAEGPMEGVLVSASRQVARSLLRSSATRRVAIVFRRTDLCPADIGSPYELSDTTPRIPISWRPSEKGRGKRILRSTAPGISLHSSPTWNGS